MERINPQNTRLVHTLFMDFVGYSRLSTGAQAEVQTILHELVAATEPYKMAVANHGIILRKTGDGMALVFFDDPLLHEDIAYPLQCACELDSAIKHQVGILQKRVGANFRLRMGVHTGNVIILSGNGEDDVAGDGINMAQRVMDCGDEGHILVSGAVAQKILDDPHWGKLLHDLGTCRVKHEELIHLFNLYGKNTDGTTIGNESIPRAIHVNRERAKERADEASKKLVHDEKEVRKTFAWQTVAGVIGIAALAGVLFLFKTIGEQQHYAKDVVGMSKKVHTLTKAKKDKIAGRDTAGQETTPDLTSEATPSTNPTPSTNANVTNNSVTVPNLIGLTSAEAERQASVVGLSLVPSTENPAQFSPTIPKGSILTQSPTNGMALPTDKKITIVLSLGSQPNIPTMPNAPENPQSNYTGVLIDASNVLMGNNPVALIGPQGQSLLPMINSGPDRGVATQSVGANPLMIMAAGAGAQGVVVNEASARALQSLPENVRTHAFVLTGTR
jgi:class 3 adenylate cyclase